MFFTAQSCGPTLEEIKISALDHFKRGNDFQQSYNYKAAIQEYKTAIALDSEQSYFFYNLALAYETLMLHDKALETYRMAIELQPDFAEAWYNLSLILYKKNDTENAFVAYEKYLKLNKDTEIKRLRSKDEIKNAPNIIK